MLDAMEKDLLHRFEGQAVHMQAAYTCSEEEAEKWKKRLKSVFQIVKYIWINCHLALRAI